MTDEHVSSEKATDQSQAGVGGKLTFDLSSPGRKGVLLPALDVPQSPLPDERFLRDDLRL
ncbi:MAG: hypothetical protein IIB18_09715, partial [Chloroflexi bacterium]|nr:hypothetical protein [Chloroflexota bacterium]